MALMSESQNARFLMISYLEFWVNPKFFDKAKVDCSIFAAGWI